RFEALPQRHHGPRRMLVQEAPHLAVEAPGPQALDLAEALALAEALGERVVDPLDQLDRERVGEHRVGTARLARPLPQRPEQGLGDAGEARVDALPAHEPAASAAGARTTFSSSSPAAQRT